jgi:hypothetical protein
MQLIVGTEVQLGSPFLPWFGSFTPVLSSLKGVFRSSEPLAKTDVRPFTDMIYSAAHKKSEVTLNKKSSSSSLGKKSTPTASTQTTPRKSSRNQVKSEDEAPSTASTTATAGESSYAAVAAHEPTAEGAGNITPPRKEPRINSIRRSARKSRGGASGTSGSEDEVATASSSASPARVTRSRSKGRTSGPGEE